MTTVVVIESRIPEVDRGCGDPRAAELGRAIAELPGVEVIWLAPDRSSRARDGARLEAWGITIPDAEPADVLCSGLRADAVVIARPENFVAFADLVDTHQPDAVRIFDFESLFHRRIERALELCPPEDRPGLTAEVRAMREIEAGAVRWADRVLCSSEDSMRFVRSVDPKMPLALVGFPVDVPATLPDLGERSGVGFFGSFRTGMHGPNGLAFRTIVEDLQPRLGCEVAIAGADIDEAVHAFASPGTPVFGLVEDHRVFLAGLRVLLCPLRLVAGVNLRLLEAGAVGTPFVTTPAAAEGLNLPAELVPYLVAESPDEIASATQRMLTDDVLWHAASEALVDLARTRWNRAAFDAGVTAAFDPVLGAQAALS